MSTMVIRHYAVTSASVHDGQVLPRLLDPEHEHDDVTESCQVGDHGFRTVFFVLHNDVDGWEAGRKYWPRKNEV